MFRVLHIYIVGSWIESCQVNRVCCHYGILLESYPQRDIVDSSLVFLGYLAGYSCSGTFSQNEQDHDGIRIVFDDRSDRVGFADRCIQYKAVFGILVFLMHTFFLLQSTGF